MHGLVVSLPKESMILYMLQVIKKARYLSPPHKQNNHITRPLTKIETILKHFNVNLKSFVFFAQV